PPASVANIQAGLAIQFPTIFSGPDFRTSNLRPIPFQNVLVLNVFQHIKLQNRPQLLPFLSREKTPVAPLRSGEKPIFLPCQPSMHLTTLHLRNHSAYLKS